MRWWGKAAAGTVGLAVFGPVGAALGVAIGHQFDRGMSEELKKPRRRTSIYPFRETLVECTFSIMGHVAMIDGKVSGRERAASTASATSAEIGMLMTGTRSAGKLTAPVAWRIQCRISDEPLIARSPCRLPAVS